MERRETVSVELKDVENCIKKKIYEQYPYLKDEDVRDLNLKSNVKFLLFEVIRVCDVGGNSEVRN